MSSHSQSDVKQFLLVRLKKKSMYYKKMFIKGFKFKLFKQQLYKSLKIYSFIHSCKYLKVINCAISVTDYNYPFSLLKFLIFVNQSIGLTVLPEVSQLSM